MKKQILPALFLLPLGTFLAGCGGSGGASTPDPTPVGGKAVVTIAWPKSSRLIPTAANSVVLTLNMAGVAPTTKTVARPAAGGNSTVTFTGLKYGSYTVDVKAYPTTDGLATAPATLPQGVGAGTLQVVENVTGTISIAMASTVASLVLTPASPSFAKGSTTSVSVSALDSSGAIVVLAAGGRTEPILWTLNSTANATLTTSGLTATLTGVHSGNVTLTASFVKNDAGQKVTASTTATVTPIDDGTGTVIIH